MKWIVEHVFDEDNRNLIKSLEKSGVQHHILSNPKYEGQWEHLVDEYEPVVTYGSIQFGELIRNVVPWWKPGHIGNEYDYLCTTYYPAFGKVALNYNYIILPFYELNNRLDILYKAVGLDNAVFIRPNSGNKPFTGRLVYKESFDHDYDMMGVYDVSPNALCLICEPRNVVSEWRFFVVQGRVVTGSMYKPLKEQVKSSDSIWGHAQTFVNEAKYNPDFIWCIDLCETSSGNIYVLEIGSFSSAGLYDCDTDVIVEAVNEIAEKEFISGLN